MSKFILFFFIITVNSFILVPSLSAENKGITLKMSDVTLAEAFKIIEKNSDYVFFYNNSEINIKKKVSAEIKNGSITKLLALIIPEYKYRIETNKIIVLPESTLQVTPKVVKGIVTDSENEPIIGASIFEKGTSNGTITDIDGAFSLKVSEGAIITLSYLGFESKEIKVDNRSKYEIRLLEDNKILEEVVVVGFGTQKKSNLTGSIGIVSSKELEGRPVMLASQALQGLIPGLNISQTNGMLESRPNINIRGRGTIGEGSQGNPLVLIDGIEGDINALNPQDIESISVFKDAAASSIYGSKASFGVILITTKRGEEGKVSISYNNNFRWNSPLLLPEMMDSYTFALYFNEAFTNAGGSPYFDQPWLDRIKDFQNGTITTSTIPNSTVPSRWDDGYAGGNDNRNYYKELYRSKASSQEHNLSINGGNKKMNFYNSFNFLDQNGLMRFNQDQYNRFGATVKVGYEAHEMVMVNYNSRFIREVSTRPSALNSSLFENIGRHGWPMLPMYDPNDNLLMDYALGLRDGGQDKRETDNLYNQIQVVFEPIKNWKTFGEVNYSIKSANRHWDTQTIYKYGVNNNSFPSKKESHVHEDQYKENLAGINLYTEYSFSPLEKHNIKAMGGTQFQSMKQTQFGFQRSGILVPGLPVGDLTSGIDFDGDDVIPSINGANNQWTTIGYFGRLNYDYNNKYLFEANLRYDGSSRYRKGNRWVWSPSFSVGWNVAHEEFWKPLQDVVGSFKLRASYGRLGNQNTSSWYPSYSSLGVTTGMGSWMMNGKRPNTVSAPSVLQNKNLTWEKVSTVNVGVDLGLFKNRLIGSFDYFIRETKDMLGPAPERPAILGVGVPKANNTDLRDYGFEMQVEWRDRLPNKLGYGLKLMLSDYQTKITKYPNLTNTLDKYIPGRVMGEIWGYETYGIAQHDEQMFDHLESLPNGGQDALGNRWAAGDIMYVDLNGDGKVDGGNRTLGDHGDLKVIGNNTPRYQFGIEGNLDWKGFDLRVFFQGVMKRDVWQDSYFFWGASSDVWWSTGFDEHLDYFRTKDSPLGENLDAFYPRPMFSGESGKNKYTQSRYLQDASYIRLKNLQIGYTLPSRITDKMQISKLRVFFSGDNLWTGTRMKDIFDPETIDGGWGTVYPLSKVLSFGLSINL